jgi:hypothetical protein
VPVVKDAVLVDAIIPSKPQVFATATEETTVVDAGTWPVVVTEVVSEVKEVYADAKDCMTVSVSLERTGIHRLLLTQ